MSTEVAVTEKSAMGALPDKPLTELMTEEQIALLVAQIRAEVESVVPDLKTKKGRKAIRSLAFRVTTSKTYLTGAFEAKIREAKQGIAHIVSLRNIVEEDLSALSQEVKAEVVAYEEHEAEKKAQAEAAAILAEQVEADHSMALVMDESWEKAAALQAEVDALQAKLAEVRVEPEITTGTNMGLQLDPQEEAAIEGISKSLFAYAETDSPEESVVDQPVVPNLPPASIGGEEEVGIGPIEEPVPQVFVFNQASFDLQIVVKEGCHYSFKLGEGEICPQPELTNEMSQEILSILVGELMLRTKGEA